VPHLRLADPGQGPPDEVAWEELRPLLQEELERLPAKYRAVVVLCCLEGLTNEEAAGQLGCPKGTVLSRLSRARDWLRRRLERRGLAPGAAMLGEMLAPCEVPVNVMAGAGRAGAASGGALALAEGVLTTMFLQQLKWVGAACLVLVLAAAGAGWLAGARGDDEKKGATATEKKGGAVQEDKKKADKPAGGDEKRAEKKAEPPPPPAPKEALAEKVEFSGLDDPKTTLQEALDQLGKIHRVTFDINEKAFRREVANNPNAVTEVLKLEVANPPIPPMKTTLDVVLRKILARVEVPSGATYIVRKDRVEITTGNALRTELGLPKLQDGEEPGEVVLVTRKINREALRRVLNDIAEETGQNIVLDPRAKKEADTELTLNLTNVPLDTALSLLADLAGLDVVRMDNVYLVTMPSNASTWRRKLAPKEGPSRWSAPLPGSPGAY